MPCCVAGCNSYCLKLLKLRFFHLSLSSAQNRVFKHKQRRKARASSFLVDRQGILHANRLNLRVILMLPPGPSLPWITCFPAFYMVVTLRLCGHSRLGLRCTCFRTCRLPWKENVNQSIRILPLQQRKVGFRLFFIQHLS
jgi:hypothetical protein